MIWESVYWKDDLLRKVSQLQRYKVQRRWLEASHAKLEQTLMLGFYGVRKLHEAGKLSLTTMDQQLELNVYPSTGKYVTRLNWHKLEELYDFDNSKTQSYSVLFLCHQFVHSYIFAASFDEQMHLEGILFASDKQRHIVLLHISIDQVIDLYEQIGNDHPASVSYVWNADKNDYDFVDISSTNKKRK